MSEIFYKSYFTFMSDILYKPNPTFLSEIFYNSILRFMSDIFYKPNLRFMSERFDTFILLQIVYVHHLVISGKYEIKKHRLLIDRIKNL